MRDIFFEFVKPTIIITIVLLYVYTGNTLHVRNRKLVNIWVHIHRETINKFEETQILKHGTNQNKTT